MPRKSLILIGIAVFLIIFLPGYSRLQELRAKNKSLLKQIEQLKKGNKELAQQIERLENDPLYIEKKARDKMGITKEGEIIYKVVDKSSKSDE